MTKVKNTSESTDVWAGMQIPPNTYYIIESVELHRWQNDSKVLSDIGSGILLVNDGTNDISDVASAINHLKGTGPQSVVSTQLAFAQKTTEDGKKLFRRKHGTKKTIPANTTDTLEIIVPYTYAKINKAEIINCSSGDTADLKVYDNSVGTISGVPNYMLNQFGFGVVMPDGMYIDESNYDADLIQGMKIELSYTNNTGNAKEVGLNITLHQLV